MWLRLARQPIYLSFYAIFLTVGIHLDGSVVSAICFQDALSGRNPTLIYPTSSDISGHVVDSDGSPIAGAIVCQYAKKSIDRWSPWNAETQESDFIGGTSTDPFGKFTLSNLDPEKSAWFRVHHPDYITRTVAPLELFGVVVLSPGERFEGLLVDHRGQPVVDATIKPIGIFDAPELGWEVKSTKTDRDGAFELAIAVDQSSSLSLQVTLANQQQVNFHWAWQVENAREDFGISAIGKKPTLRLPAPKRLEFKLVDAETGRVLPLNSFAVANMGERRGGIPNFYQNIVIENQNQATHSFHAEGEVVFRLEPMPDSGYPARLVRVEANQVKSDRPIEVVVQRGAKLTGRVIDADSKQPIPQAAVRFIPDDATAVLKAGITFPFARTDDDGEFSLTVPAVAGRLQVVGECRGYRTLPSTKTYELSDYGRACLERAVKPEPGDVVRAEAFELIPSPLITGKVVNESGLPVAGVNFTIQRDLDYWQHSPEFGKTDALGRFEIRTAFCGPSQEMLPEGSRSCNDQNGQVHFWHKGLTENARLPFETLSMSELRGLEVRLAMSQAAIGRVVDVLTKEPVEDAMVIAKFIGDSIQVGCKTDDVGEYFLEHLPRSINNLTAQHPEYDQSGLQLRVIGDRKPDETPLIRDLPDIEIIKIHAFGKPGPIPDWIEGNPDKNLERAVAYLQQELAKVPAEIAALALNGKYQGAVQRFKESILEAILPTARKLFDENQPAEFRSKAAILMATAIAGDGYNWFRPHETGNLIRENLEANLNSAAAWDAYSRFGDNGDRRRSYFLLQNTTYRPARRMLLNKSLNYVVSNVQRSLRTDVHRLSDEEFDSMMEQAKQVFPIVLLEFNEPDFETDNSLAGLARNYVKMIERSMSQPDIDVDRAKRLKALIDSLPVEN